MRRVITLTMKAIQPRTKSNSEPTHPFLNSQAEGFLFWLLAAAITFAIGAAVSSSLGSLQQWPRFVKLVEGLIS